MLSIMNVSERPIEGDSDENRNKMSVVWSTIGESKLITPFTLILSSYLLMMLIETVYKQSDAVTNQSVGKDAAAVETDEAQNERSCLMQRGIFSAIFRTRAQVFSEHKIDMDCKKPSRRYKRTKIKMGQSRGDDKRREVRAAQHFDTQDCGALCMLCVCIVKHKTSPRNLSGK
jgi:hypothetical protein